MPSPRREGGPQTRSDPEWSRLSMLRRGWHERHRVEVRGQVLRLVVAGSGSLVCQPLPDRQQRPSKSLDDHADADH